MINYLANKKYEIENFIEYNTSRQNGNHGIFNARNLQTKQPWWIFQYHNFPLQNN